MSINVRDIAAQVNFAVNSDVRYRVDMELYGRAEFWTVVHGLGEGDCDDYALTKRHRLLAAGVPLELLRLAVVFTETEEGRRRLAVKRSGVDYMGDHALLVVSAEDGDWLLDNRLPLLTRMSDTGYDLDRIQVPHTLVWEHGVLPGAA